MPLTDSSVAVTQAIFDLLDVAREDLGLAAVHYGDTALTPEYPSIMVESGPKGRPLVSSGTRRFALELTSFVNVLHGAVQDVDTTKKETEELAEAIEVELHKDYTLGDLVIFGHVVAMDPGVILRPSVVLRATRLTWQGISRKNF